MNTTLFIRRPVQAKQAPANVEERYARLLASVTDYVYTVTIDRGLPIATSHGAGCEAVTGYSSDEFEGDPELWMRIICEEDRPAVQAHTARVLNGQTPSPVEFRLVHKNGSVRWVKHRAVAHRNELGQLVAYDGLVSDITERRRAEEEHRLSEERLQAILDHSPAIIHLKDTRGRYLLVNRRFEQLFRVTREEVVGHAPYDLFARETADILLNHDRQVMAARSPMEFEETLPQQGELHTYISVKFPLLDANGTVYALCGISTDITERKRAEAELNRACWELSENEAALKKTLHALQAANAQLKATQLQLIQAAKLESVGTLAAGVAHEVKNPLQTVLMGLDYLGPGLKAEDPNVPSVLADMRGAVTRANTIVRGLLDFAAPTPFELAVGDLNAVIPESLRLINSKAVASRVEVVRDLEPGALPVKMDWSKMQQVFINLFINAIQAMANGGVLTVRTRSGRCGPDLALSTAVSRHFRHADRLAKVEVQDTGPGIPHDNLAKVFDPFFTTKPPGEGFGLGLAVVRKIVDLHGGYIDIHNGPQGGALVTLILRTHTEKAA